MTAPAICVPVFLLIGMIIALGYDRHEMRKEIPFGTWPSLWDTKTLRRIVACLCVFFWPYAFGCFFAGIFRGIRNGYRQAEQEDREERHRSIERDVAVLENAQQEERAKNETHQPS
jgi:hypothetical protein